MPFLGLIFIFIFFVFYIQFLMRKGYSNYRKTQEKVEAYLEEERQANFSRKKDIDEQSFIKPDWSRLPLNELSPTKKDMLMKLGQSKMLRFETPMTNRELKLMYGMANFEAVIAYEETFQKFSRELLEWAEGLYKGGKNEACLVVLEELIRLNSELSRVYFLYTDLICENQEVKNKKLVDKLDDLSILVKNLHMNDVIKTKILNYINDKISLFL